MSAINQYTVRGRVIDAATNRPLPGLHVRAYNKDLIWDDRLGSDQTDAQGDFTLCFFEHDFKEPFEGHPEIYMVVYGPDKKELYCTEPIRPEKGQTEIHVHVPVDAGPLVTAPRISHVVPDPVWPGTFVEIHGDNFGDRYSDVTVMVGGREALVLEACPGLEFIIDGTGRTIQQHSDPARQQQYYSGKKKQHTVKNIKASRYITDFARALPPRVRHMPNWTEAELSGKKTTLPAMIAMFGRIILGRSRSHSC